MIPTVMTLVAVAVVVAGGVVVAGLVSLVACVLDGGAPGVPDLGTN